MECKIIQKGNAFYEIDDECMEKKEKINKQNKPVSSYKKTSDNPSQSSNENRSVY